MTERYLPAFRRAAMRTDEQWPDELYYLLPVFGMLPSFTPIPVWLVLPVVAVAIFAFMGKQVKQSDKINDDGTMPTRS